MRVLGISAGAHDAAVTVLEGQQIKFAAHAERYSRFKNDFELNFELMREALAGGKPDVIAWYEKPWKRKVRYMQSGQWQHLFDAGPREIVSEFGLEDVSIETFDHHLSHAAAGYYTSGFEEAAVLVVDAIGELDTLTIWEAKGTTLDKRFTCSYPDSLGLFYSAMTQRCGLKPNEEEYILMGMAAYGERRFVDEMVEQFFDGFDPPNLKLKHNLHRGCMWWRPELKSPKDLYDIAASAQWIVERFVAGTGSWIISNLPSRNLVFMGGVALNCVANRALSLQGFDSIWIMPNPGDAGSSLGAAALIEQKHLHWEGPYLGHEIPGVYPVRSAVEALTRGEIIGIANGRAEFGPRALGNRSLLADPRGPGTKDRVNQIKQRQKFRPFAPVILEEHAYKYFGMPAQQSPYMQYTAPCFYPEQFPAIVHVDGRSRVQTVNQKQHPGLYDLLSEFNERTGCPMLLNTSLNIRGEPLVNSQFDGHRFSQRYGIEVFFR